MEISDIVRYLSEYDGPEMNIMEVCGSHTGAIAKNGIPDILSPKLHLLSGPGCPVCVTPSAYIDRLIELACTPGYAVVTFGDLIRVPGSKQSLSMAKGDGADVRMVYSPLDTVELARKEPEITFIFAAIGFETTTPVYALLVDEIMKARHTGELQNVRLLTALKTMPAAIDYICSENAGGVQGFIAPGHVSAVTGYGIFEPLAEKYSLPFGVSGFKAEELLAALYAIVRSRGEGRVMNLYPSVVSREANPAVSALIDKYFEESDAVWRGMGNIQCSGRLMRREYRELLDMGSEELSEDVKLNKACRCAEILIGKAKPRQCPLYGRVCTPDSPQGACMVSTEGSCYSYFTNNRVD